MLNIFISNAYTVQNKNTKLEQQLQLLSKIMHTGTTRKWRIIYLAEVIDDVLYAGAAIKPAATDTGFSPTLLYVTGHGGAWLMPNAWLQDADINGNGRSDELWPGTGEQEIMLWENKTRPERCISLLPARYITPKIPANRKKPLFGGTHSGGGNISEQLVHSNVVQPAPYTGNARKWPPLCLS